MTARDAPISRGLVDEALPWLRALLGLIFVAYSANSTIFIGAADLMYLFKQTQEITIGGFPDAYWYSAFLALLLFVGEIATSERYPRAYRLFLGPDVVYTARGLFVGLSLAFTVLVEPTIGDREIARIVGGLLALPTVAVVGYIIAKWGEVLLFGKRRQNRRTRKED